MSLKDKLLFVLVLLVVAATFLFSHYWTCALFVIQRAVATGVLPLILPKSLVGVAFTCFLL
ncbi:MAG TPA: hypothetical protein VMH48_02700 [Methylomirabilota bacterium]|nr:hypothetical protein [Methylomirabilota bacterium]